MSEIVTTRIDQSLPAAGRAKRWVFRVGLGVVALIIPLVLLGLLAFLTLQAWPAIQFNGFGFLVSNDWDLGSQYGTPVSVDGHQVLPGASYGILFLIFGTLASSLLAVLFALPAGVLSAMFIAEVVPQGARDVVAAVVELLAAVPSVVFGLWGYVVVIPVFSHYVYPLMADVLGFIPGFGGPVGAGYGLLTAGVVLALMVVPIITANVREAISAVSRGDVEAGFALGATRFEVVWKVVLPQVKTAIVGVTILGLGRALGETMAVLMVSGNALDIPSNIYSPFSTMAAFIVSQLDSALQDPTGMAVDSLSEIGLMLLILGIIVNSIARLIMWRVRG
ncbi:phosphate ABC transporter permease subunit PstC [Salinisphaera hydrothermalis]|uniref:Phosphate transport system permease protein n=1 Tax=Salinisphaera hydrothermalis (strain C41B8) TaxID=1304275 RepID=A0A084IQA4_SALHC|nr:phosphate ABC transporter permease subunit PstC [Salinisphaera hydrothermalis]KEZ78888.1 phosphate transport system permease pstC [Salinisphaera hydrothermalis C41B8]